MCGQETESARAGHTVLCRYHQFVYEEDLIIIVKIIMFRYYDGYKATENSSFHESLMFDFVFFCRI